MLLDHMYMHVLLDEMWGSNAMWDSMEVHIHSMQMLLVSTSSRCMYTACRCY
jgi:hypothetical protein